MLRDERETNVADDAQVADVFCVYRNGYEAISAATSEAKASSEHVELRARRHSP